MVQQRFGHALILLAGAKIDMKPLFLVDFVKYHPHGRSIATIPAKGLSNEVSCIVVLICELFLILLNKIL